MAKRTDRKLPRLGTVLALPLPNGKFAFAKVLKDHNLGVYDLVADRIEPIEVVTKHKLALYQGVVDAPLKSGEWPVIGEEPFANDDDAWPPARAMGMEPGEPIDPDDIGLEYKGASRRARLDEIVGLEIYSLYTTPKAFIDMVVDRLVKGNDTKYWVSP